MSVSHLCTNRSPQYQHGTSTESPVAGRHSHSRRRGRWEKRVNPHPVHVVFDGHRCQRGISMSAQPGHMSNASLAGATTANADRPIPHRWQHMHGASVQLRLRFRTLVSSTKTAKVQYPPCISGRMGR
jgi:hypothetical protein